MAVASASQTVLITGVTGSFGQAMLRRLLATTEWTIRGLSRSELLQHTLRASLTPEEASRVRLFLGDVRDLPRLRLAFAGVQTVFHAAALKHVPAGEYDPSEFVATNILGTQNVITACVEHQVARAVLLSTDKSVAPVNLYGTTKATAERLWIRANSYSPEASGTAFMAVRYGNVTKSRGSVLDVWERQRAGGQPLTLTDPAMTRFWITLDDAVTLALWTATAGERGYLYVPKLPAYKVRDLAEACYPGVPQAVTGIRPGEKLHEELLARGEQHCLRRLLHRVSPDRVLAYYGLPPTAPSWATPPPSFDPVDLPLVTRYDSETWTWRLDVAGLRAALETA